MGLIKFGYADFQCELPRGELYIPAGHEKNEKEILQKNDIARLFKESSLWYWSSFCFMVLTGVRPGECYGLQLADLDEDCVYIRRAVNSRNYITEGKNENARRVVPIGSTAKAIIRQTIARNEAHKLHTEWIFCAPDGSHGNQNSATKHWYKLKEERQLPGTLYSLRHTFVSITKNVLPEASLKAYVGHSSSFDTYGHYAHELDDDRRKTAEIIDLTFSDLGQNCGPN